jgi:VWFA-related protein
MRLTKLTLTPTLILALLSPLAAAAQAPVSSAPLTRPADVEVPGIQTLHVTTREVIVDVIVTDDKGNPVHGLTQSSFTVSENGHPQVIRSFREITSNPPPERPAPKLPLGIYTNSHAMPATGPVNIFLIDSLNHGAGIYTLQAITGYFKKMPQGTQIALFWLTATGLHTLQPFTSDRDALLTAIDTQSQLINLEQLGLGPQIDNWTRKKTTAAAFNQIATYVSGIKGRKNLFWFTAGMPINLMRDGGYAWDDGPGDMTMVHRLMDTYELLTAAQVAVYPVNQGVGPLTMKSLKLEAVAEDMGGEAIYNTNDFTSPLAKAIDKGSQFYSLSYIPPKQTDDGHYHHINVELDQPHLHLVYRKGYNAERLPTVDNPAPGPALMKASMEGNAPPATALLFDVAVQPVDLAVSPAKSSMPPPKKPSKSSGPRTYPYQITYGFPGSQISFSEGVYQRLHGKLEFDVVAYDATRARVALLTQTVDLPLTIDQIDDFVAAPFRFTQTVELPAGQLSLHVGILDTVSNKVGTLEIPITVGLIGRPSARRSIRPGLNSVPEPFDPANDPVPR